MDALFAPAPHTEAAAIIRGKPVVARAVFDGLLPELRGRVFTIAGVEAANVMQRIRDSIATIAEGDTWKDAKDNIIAELDPFLGDGADRRAELLLRTHGFQAFQATNWRVAQADDDTTHLQYLTMEDERVRPGHTALEGVILPKNDPFWQTHFPPWEWGCRCRTRPMNPELVDEARKADASRAPDDQLVMEGPALQKLREGTIVRNGRTTSVLPPEGDSAFHWHPDDLRIALADLQQRYDPEVWQAFVEFARANELASGVSLMDWLGGSELPAERSTSSVAFSDVDAAQEWADENMHPDNLALTALERGSLIDYQRSSHSLNSALQRAALTPALRRQTSALDRAFKKSIAEQTLTVWHGSGSRMWDVIEAGDQVQLKSFLSTTLAEEFEDFKSSTWIEIEVPAGSPAIYMDQLDGEESHAKEVEILLSRKSKLQIISIDRRDEINYVSARLIT